MPNAATAVSLRDGGWDRGTWGDAGQGGGGGRPECGRGRGRYHAALGDRVGWLSEAAGARAAGQGICQPTEVRALGEKGGGRRLLTDGPTKWPCVRWGRGVGATSWAWTRRWRDASSGRPPGGRGFRPSIILDPEAYGWASIRPTRCRRSRLAPYQPTAARAMTAAAIAGGVASLVGSVETDRRECDP